MPSRLSGIFARSPKEQEAKAEEAASHRNGQSSDPVPHYSVSEPPPPDYQNNDDGVAPPDYTAGFTNLSISDAPSSDIPSVNEAIAHLKTLECFSRLRQTVASTDGLFGIHNAIIVEIARSSNLASGEGTDELLPKLAEKRWAIYISRAVDRFHAWVSAAVPEGPMPTIAELQHDGQNDMIMRPDYVKQAMQPIRQSNMPPLDIIMIWHAYMLNPRAYLEDCVRLGRMALWNTKIPWDAIAECINPSTFVFEAGAVAEGAFTRLTGHYVSTTLITGEIITLTRTNQYSGITSSTAMLRSWTAQTAMVIYMCLGLLAINTQQMSREGVIALRRMLMLCSHWAKASRIVTSAQFALAVRPPLRMISFEPTNSATTSDNC
jgi:hypothetical protein